MFKFVQDDTGGIGSKRKRTKTCDDCRRRHKRCYHEKGPPVDDARLSDIDAGNPSPKSGPTRSEAPRIESDLLVPSTASSEGGGGALLRFVGDLSPEASFLTNSHRNRSTNATGRRGEIGVWLGQGSHEQSRTEEEHDEGTVTVEPALGPSFRLSGLSGFKALYPYLRRECMSVLPPAQDFDAIRTVYQARFEPIFPILHGESPHRPDPLESCALRQGICLLATFDPSTAPHLRLQQSPSTLLSPETFRARISEAIRQTLNADFIRDKVVLLQVTALVAFYANTESSSSEISSWCCSQAVQIVQTLGLHLGWPGEPRSTPKLRCLFWCVWVLDRLNAATNGRPILIHTQDMDRRALESVPALPPPFRLLVDLARYLDETISQYRPHASGTNEASTPSFEQFVCDAGATDIDAGLMSTLEVFYLAIVILQSRSRNGGGTSSKPSSDTQFLSAASILNIISEAANSAPLTYFATFPYAVSLATSVAYQTLRNSRIAQSRKRATSLFHECCTTLDTLSATFTSARTMARLAKNAMQEMERSESKESRRKTSKGHRPHDPRPGALSDLTAARPTRSLQAKRAAAATAPPAPLEETAPAQARSDALYTFDGGSQLGSLDIGDFTFDLDQFDAMFAAHLDPTMPLGPGEWIPEYS